MPKRSGRALGTGALRVAWAAVLTMVLPIGAAAQTATERPAGRGFIFGGALGGGQLSFGGARNLALALGPVEGQETISSWGSATTYDVRSAWVVPSGESAPGAEVVVPFASQGAGGFSMHAGYAFNSRVALLTDVGVWAGNFNECVGGFLLRVWPTSRVWVEAGPAFGDLAYAYENSVVRTGSLTGTGFSAVAGVSVVRHPRFSLDLEARLSRVTYEAGFRVNTFTVQLGASRVPLPAKARS